MKNITKETRLKNWTIIKSDNFFLLDGIVYSHYSSHCHDGSSVTTSWVDDVKITDDELVVKTQNTKYHLSYKDISDCWDYKQDSAFGEFVEEFSLQKLEECLETAVDARNKQFAQIIDAVDKKLENTMLYIEISDSVPWNCNLAIYKNSHGVSSRAVSKMQEEAVTVSDADGECCVGYFVNENNTMIFYNTLFSAIPDEKLTDPTGTVMGYIKNVGDNKLTVIFSWGKKINIKPESEFQIVYGMGK